MHEFYSSSDVVVNTLPSSAGTVGFVDEAAFRAMKDTAVFVNIGRGGASFPLLPSRHQLRCARAR